MTQQDGVVKMIKRELMTARMRLDQERDLIAQHVEDGTDWTVEGTIERYLEDVYIPALERDLKHATADREGKRHADPVLVPA